MQKNVTGQKWVVFAFQGEGGANPGAPVTGDAANITANLRLDGGAANAVDDTNPVELEDGYYAFDITQSETNADMILIAPESSTANVTVIGAPAVVFTTPANFPELGIESDGDLTQVNTLNGHTAQTGDSFARIGANGASLSAIPWNASWDAEVQSEANDALVALGLDHLVSASVVGGDVADDSIIAQLVSASGTADWDSYDNASDSLEALRNRGDAAWTTGGGGSITDLLNVIPMIPPAIDLANTASWRIGFQLTNALDDLPSTSEITPGTVTIERKIQGGTSWGAVVTNGACSEAAGLIYYDEVFDTASGYAAGDLLRFTFKGQGITVSANDYEITDGTVGATYYSGIIADKPDVNVASINNNDTAASALRLFALAVDQSTGQLDSGSFASNSITASTITDGLLTSAKIGTGFVTTIQSGLATATALQTVDSNVDTALVDIAAVQTTADAIETDTQNIQSRLPASLVGGAISADIESINGTTITGDGQPGTEFGVA